jgi:DNA polymerase III subunit gamma/tau
MSYMALARKWRPRGFSELVGQEHVRRALVNSLTNGRVHHAFLFAGTRGVGKTTIARILAKCLNCERGVSAEPCGQCAACREIDAGRFVDLLEVDAASRTKVDDTRELLDNVQYAPTRARYKVYLIDEVHMLSTHSFNALLKTLEEPPPHVKFLLATTDPQKLPVTVLSRCLQFNLKRLPSDLIAERMRHILEAESIPFEAAAVRLIAHAADGSMRDALSLLDQLIAFGDGRAGEAEARAMLGTVARDQVVQFVEHLAAFDAAALMGAARALAEFAPDYAQVLEELAALLARIALKQSITDYAGDELYAAELLARLAERVAPEDVQLFYQTAILGRRDLALAPDPRTGFEMTLLRMLAFRPGEAGVPRAAPQAAARTRIAPESAAAPPAVPAAPLPPPAAATPWSVILNELELSGAARQLASHCVLLGHERGLVRLGLDPARPVVSTPALQEKLAQALSRYFGEPVRLEFETIAADALTPARAQEHASLAQLAAARESLESDPGVRALRERFGATLVPESVRPIK